MLTWFYALTGRERYLRLLEETYQWMRSVEHPGPGGGWAYQFLPDGTEVFTAGYKPYRYDRPETWPRPHHPRWGKPRRTKVQLEDTEKVLNIIERGGLAALRPWYVGPARYTADQYLGARVAAARRVTDENLQVALVGRPGEGVNGAIRGRFLERVRQRWARPDLPDMSVGRSSGYGAVAGHNQGNSGETSTEKSLAKDQESGIDVMGDWTTRAVEVENWIDVPLAQFE
jgi:hypothetical protein